METVGRHQVWGIKVLSLVLDHYIWGLCELGSIGCGAHRRDLRWRYECVRRATEVMNLHTVFRG